MSAHVNSTFKPAAAPWLILGGLVLAVGAWLLPVNLKSVSPPLLKAAGAGTPTLAEFGRQLVDSEQIGPSALVLAAARKAGDPGAPALATALDRLVAREPTLAAWGGWDPSLDPLFHLHLPSGHAASTPVITFFLPETARTALTASLANSGSLGVQALLRLRDLTSTGRFVPARRPGGQPLDALILLSAALYQDDRLSPPLQRELRGMAEAAAGHKDLGDLSPFFLDLLSLARRLDWTQLGELLRRTDSTGTVAQYAQLARVSADSFPLIYTAALFADSADKVGSYLIRYGSAGVDDLRLAMADGRGAAQLLVLRQVPINREGGPALSAAGALVLAHPQLMLGLKYLGYLLGLFLVLRGLDRWIVSPTGAAPPAGAVSHVRAAVLAVGLAALAVVATEPFLLRGAPPSDYQRVLRLPVLVASAPSPLATSSQPNVTMEASTLLSIAIFALLQIGVYLICLRKINQISQVDAPPLLKLRLMENEDNLFDSGLYVGMMGTAAALVLQVLGVIEPNLLAAYSSNLFGLLCVALVKIRHVRNFKRRLILLNENPTGARLA